MADEPFSRDEMLRLLTVALTVDKPAPQVLADRAARFHEAAKGLWTDPVDAARVEQITAGLAAQGVFADLHPVWLDLGDYEGFRLYGRADGGAVRIEGIEYARRTDDVYGVVVAIAFHRLDNPRR